MIAVDTNVLVRLLIVDDSHQSRAVRALFEREPVLILRTVLLETEWLLRARFDVDREGVNAFFGALLDTENIEFENEAYVRDAVDLHANGFDFADAMHLAAVGSHPLTTFDARFAKRAARIDRDVQVLVPSD